MMSSMKKLKMKKWLLLNLVFLPYGLLANALQNVEMADEFRKDGKIYVVVMIIMIVLLGLIAYTFRIDHKITKLEKRLNKDD